MQVESLNKKQKYILAISGGVDSVVLLHKTMAHHSSEGGSNVSFIVAHFDHGMRPESADDAEFVRKLAESYGLEYAMERAELGESASEEQARNARYAFLSRVMVDNKAHGIVTAHHQDDVLETMVSNILRGTSPRGLRGFTLRSIIRPLLHVPKSDIMAYADTHSLQWRQDSTNDDTTYTRNYIRKHVMPQLENDRGALLSIRERIITNYTEIDDLISKLLVQTVKKGALVRAQFVAYPYVVQKELMATYLRIQGLEIDSSMVVRAVTAAQTMMPGKHIELSKGVSLHSLKHTVSLRSDKKQ